jgi:hypothetical protein
MTNTTLRRAKEREDAAFGGSAGLAGSVSRPLAIDLEKFRSKGLPIRLGRYCSKFPAFFMRHFGVMVSRRLRPDRRRYQIHNLIPLFRGRFFPENPVPG